MDFLEGAKKLCLGDSGSAEARIRLRQLLVVVACFGE